MQLAGLMTAALMLVAMPAAAQTYPDRPIRILVPYAPGGITDIAARIVGDKLGQAFGQQVVVENRPGGSGFIAMTAAARAAPDGYTLVLCTGGEVAIDPSLFKTMPYDVDRDLAPIAAVSDAPLVLATNARTSFKSVADVLAAARAQPGFLNVATPGYGSINHLVLEWVSLETGTRFQHIPYKGGAPAAQALVAGDVPLGILASSSVAPYVTSGSVRVLATTLAHRSRLDPEWPTLREEGIPAIEASNWTALFAPKGTPPAILDKLNGEVVRILALPDVKEHFAAGGVETIPSRPDELAARITRDAANFRKIIQAANVHVE